MIPHQAVLARPAPSSSWLGHIPTVLDALIPGLGHLAAGRQRRAVLGPVLVALAAAVGTALTNFRTATRR